MLESLRSDFKMLMLELSKCRKIKDMSIFKFAKFEYYLNRAKFHPSATHILSQFKCLGQKSTASS